MPRVFVVEQNSIGNSWCRFKAEFTTKADAQEAIEEMEYQRRRAGFRGPHPRTRIRNVPENPYGKRE